MKANPEMAGNSHSDVESPAASVGKEVRKSMEAMAAVLKAVPPPVLPHFPLQIIGPSEQEEDHAEAILSLLQEMPDLGEVFLQALELAKAKNESYGDAWRKRGYMGNLARVLNKSDRLQNMMWQDNGDAPEAFSESVEDTLIDLINISAFMYINLREGNRWGSQQQ